MAEKNTPSTTVEVTEQQRQIVLGALTEKLLDCNRYLSGSKTDDTPGPLDNCCDAHLARYEHRRDTYRALKRQKKDVQGTLDLFESKEV